MNYFVKYASSTSLLFSKNVFHDDIRFIKGNSRKINKGFPWNMELKGIVRGISSDFSIFTCREGLISDLLHNDRRDCSVFISQKVYEMP